MPDKDIALMAHLLRRAGFGATRTELEAYCAKGYEAIVEELLHPENAPAFEDDLVSRYRGEWSTHDQGASNRSYWLYRMINTKRPLEEKITLFWHGILCVGLAKLDNNLAIQSYIEMLRRCGLGDFRTLLLELSRNPAMIFFLGNCMSHKNAINENWGRELLELFSMGIGMDGRNSYTEDDVKACARAFTGWTRGNPMPFYPYGRFDWRFKYDASDHDDEEKTFLGETGRWNGEDVIDIIVRQPATARFISRHLYNFFVADEPLVPTWKDSPPRDLEAIETLEKAYFDSNYDIRSMLRVLLNANFFKNAHFAKVKSPAEVLAGTMRLVGGFEEPKPGVLSLEREMQYMGMMLLEPPTVEGWHTGQEWIDSGTLVERINFVAGQVGNVNAPGIRAIIDRLGLEGRTLSAERLVDGCLDMVGGYELPEETRSQLVAYAERGGEVSTGTEKFAQRVGQVLQLIVATLEYQFA
jgi:uncharacterized protein (DUF1800 family)